MEMCTESKLREHTAEKQEEKKFFFGNLTGAMLQKSEKILETVAEIPGIRSGTKRACMSAQIPESGKFRILFQDELERNGTFFGSKGEFQIQNRAGKAIRNLQTVRHIRSDKDKLPVFQQKFRILSMIETVNPAGTGGNIHDLIALVGVMLHMITGKGKCIKSGNMKISGRILENIGHGKTSFRKYL